MKKKIYMYIGLGFFLALILIIQSQSAGEEKSILVMLENPIELLNVVIALFIASFALNVSKMIGGQQGKAWTLITVAAMFFAIVEILGVLKGFGIWHIGGLVDFVEMCFVITLLAGFWEQKKIFSNILKQGK